MGLCGCERDETKQEKQHELGVSVGISWLKEPLQWQAQEEA